MINKTGQKRDAGPYLRYAVLATAVVFIIAGIAGGQPLSVLNKAIRICLECIGIG